MADLTTKAKVKSFLGIASGVTTYDTLFDTLCKNVSALIERYCNRTFTETSYTEYFDVNSGDEYVFLRNFPVASLTSVKYRTGPYSAIVWQDFNANDYLLYESRGRIKFCVRLPEADKYIQVVYTGGYKIDFTHETDPLLHTLPGDLEQIATEWVAKIYNMRKAQGILSESTEGQSITFKESNSGKEFRDGLSSYKNILI